MAVPGIPTNLAVAQGGGNVALKWDPTATATGYVVQRATDGLTFSNVGTPTIPSFTDTTGTVGTQYWYQVAASNGSGTGSFTASQTTVPCGPGSMSLLEVRGLAKLEADMVNSQFVTNQEWDSYINQSYFELYDLLTTTFEDYYVASPFTFTTDGTNQLFALPDGITVKDSNGVVAPAFYKVLGLDLGLTGNVQAFVTLKKFNFISRNRYLYPQLTSTFLGVFNLQYRLLGNKIMFIPTPASGQTIRMWYEPRLTKVLLDTDILDGVSGWTEYVIVDAAMKALGKEESDISALALRKEALIKRIEETAPNRDEGQPDTISDTRTRAESWGGYGPPGGDGSYGGY